ncbi:rho GTPase-activating protein 15-like, partial [Nelusetta ayraudi]|uniref:rho GTPase-activating protein 15-like n=1 Tax=Nelusetta ayraudi TaxID=303726 RepID=UPI003F6FC1AE
ASVNKPLPLLLLPLLLHPLLLHLPLPLLLLHLLLLLLLHLLSQQEFLRRCRGLGAAPGSDQTAPLPAAAADAAEREGEGLHQRQRVRLPPGHSVPQENSAVPRFLDKCVRVVDRRGLEVDGIYRVSGNLAVIQKLRHKADHEEHLDLDDGQWEEIHVITGALKLFLRELPEPLFPFSFFDKFIAAIQVPDYSQRVSYMKDLVRSLPLPNHNTMELLFKHLRRVMEHQDSNRMSVQSLAIVFGPTLLRPQTESANMTVHMVFQSQIVELLLNEFRNIFSQTQEEMSQGPSRTL